jgi:hypothetical protein
MHADNHFAIVASSPTRLALAAQALLAAALMTMALFAVAPAMALPMPLTSDLSEAKSLIKRGEGTLRFFGLKVYDIRLWTPAKPHSHDELFALELVYDLGLKGAEIAKRSTEEMRKIGYSDEAKLARWTETMTRIFPDIKKGDSLIGVSIPGKEARFYSQNKLIAAVQDPEFAKAFFDIWLSEKTSEPKLRRQLMAIK